MSNKTEEIEKIKRLREVARRKEMEKKLSTIYDLSKKMSLSLDLDQISKIVLDATEKVLNFGNVDLFLVDKEKNELRVKESRGLKEPERYTVIPIFGEKGISAYVARTGESLNIPDIRKDERYLLGLKGARSELCVPIKARDKIIGVIDAESKELNAFSKGDQRLLETLASQAGVAMENARLFGELRESEERLRGVFDASEEIIFTKDVGGYYTHANAAFSRIFKKPIEEIVGKTDKEIFSEKEAKMLRKIDLKLLESGEIDTREDILTVGGEVRIFKTTKVPLRNEVGKIVGLCGFAQDITERKKIEEALKESEERFRALIENSSDIIQIVDSEGIIRYVSPSVQRILGYRPEELVGKSSIDVVHPDDLPLVAKGFEKAVRNPHMPVVTVCRCKHKNGTWRIIEGTGANYLDNPIVNGFISNMHDITEHKQLEQEREKAKREAEFYSDVLGHDVGNINQIISGYLYLLENAKDEETRKKNVIGIKKSIMKSARLAESIKILKIIKDTKIEKFDLNESIERSIKNIKEYSDREIEVNLNIDKKYYVKANDFLDKVFFNILENSVEYTFHDPVIIDVKIEEKDGFCNAHIHDNGLGIPKEKKEDILENLETLSKRTGMGFYLMKKILERFNGKFEIKDVEKGTEIVISISVINGGSVRNVHAQRHHKQMEGDGER